MIKNSQRRISKRRVGALERRLNNQKEIRRKEGSYADMSDEVLGIKLSRINSDIESLQKKGVRV